jgi:hypothetical protein
MAISFRGGCVRLSEKKMQMIKARTTKPTEAVSSFPRVLRPTY